MTAPLPPALDYLIGQLETTAEKCQGGDGSNNALRKNGRGEGLRIAAALLRDKWPAIQAEVLATTEARLSAVEVVLDHLSSNPPENLRRGELFDEGWLACRGWVQRQLRRALGLPPKEDR